MALKSTFNKRKQRVRTALKLRANNKVRLSVFRSAQHIYAQLIDDSKGQTIAHASTLEAGSFNEQAKTSNIAAAEVVGKLIAERAKKINVETIVFDRGGYIYHGRVKALADAARQHGLKF